LSQVVKKLPAIYTCILIFLPQEYQILRTEIEIRDKISLNDILIALHSNTIIVEGLDYQSYVNKRIKEIRAKNQSNKEGCISSGYQEIHISEN